MHGWHVPKAGRLSCRPDVTVARSASSRTHRNLLEDQWSRRHLATCGRGGLSAGSGKWGERGRAENGREGWCQTWEISRVSDAAVDHVRGWLPHREVPAGEWFQRQGQFCA